MGTAVIILNYNDKKNAIRLAKDLYSYETINKIVIVDNCSPNNDYEELKELKNNKIDVIKSDKNGGYSYGNNKGLNYLESNYGEFDYIIISNTDVEIKEEAIKGTINYLENHKDIGIAAPRVTDSNGNKYLVSGWKTRNIKEDTVLQSAFLSRKYIKKDLERLLTPEEREQEEAICDCISGCFFIIKGKVFKEINYFDDKLFIYGEEDIIGQKIKKLNLKACVLNKYQVIHYESVSINKSYTQRKKLRHLHNSLYYYYKKYDENVKIKDLVLFKLAYYFGEIEYYICKKILHRK